jgi:hypothetical protein
VDHGPGGHDDLANAACGALALAGVRSVLDDFAGVPAGPITFVRGGGAHLGYGDPAPIDVGILSSGFAQ